jgi:hypothetical protein
MENVAVNINIMRSGSILLAIGAMLLAGVANADINSGMVAYWPFDGDAADASGNGNEGTVYGATPTADRFGNNNSAYYFEFGNYIVTEHGGPLGSSPRTISLWAKTPSANTQVMLVWGGGASNPGSDFRAELSYGAEGVSPDISYGAVTYAAHVADDQWHHYAYVLPDKPNPTVSDVEAYMDGTLLTEVVAWYSPNQIVDTTSVNPYTIGRYFHGALDDVRVYDRALSPEEIWQLARGEPQSGDTLGTTVQLSPSYEFSLEQGAQDTQSIHLTNPGSETRSATLEMVNPHTALTVSVPEPRVTVAPGETKAISINLAAGTTRSASTTTCCSRSPWMTGARLFRTSRSTSHRRALRPCRT